MKRYITYVFAFLLCLEEATAQDNMQVQFAYRGSVAAAKYLPSTQLMTDHKFEGSLQYSVWVANTSLSYATIRKIYTQNRLSRQEVNDIVDNLEEDNRFGVGQDFLVLGFGLKTNIRKKPFVWSFTVSDRLNANSHIPKEFVQLVWQGNKQFEGETLNLSNTSVIGLYFREFSLGVASDLAKWGEWNFRGGMRLNYYQGISGIDQSHKQSFFTTEVGAERIIMDYDFEFYHTGLEEFNLFNINGHGFGMNLGTSFSYKDKLNLDLGITDIGFIQFNKDVTRVEGKNDFTFSGFDETAIIDPTAFLDSLEAIFTPLKDSLGNNSFRMPIGTRLSFMASWMFGKATKNNGPRQLSFYYTQGFSENPGVTTNPMFTLALHRRILKHMVIGLSTSYGGFGAFALGGLVGAQFKNFRFSVQSDNFTGLILQDTATGGGGGFIFQYLF